jgi:hypothetical protein
VVRGTDRAPIGRQYRWRRGGQRQGRENDEQQELHGSGHLFSSFYKSIAISLYETLPARLEEASLFFRLASYRYGRGSILITTSKGIRDWPEVERRTRAAATRAPAAAYDGRDHEFAAARAAWTRAVRGSRYAAETRIHGQRRGRRALTA